MIAFYYFLAEGLSVGFTSFIVFIIKWLKNPDAEL